MLRTDSLEKKSDSSRAGSTLVLCGKLLCIHTSNSGSPPRDTDEGPAPRVSMATGCLPARD
jgi:hypothetical protein